MSEYNPFEAPTSFGDIASENHPLRHYGGLRRLPYFGYGFLLNVVINILQAVAGAAEVPVVALLMIPISIGGAVALAWQRCKNIGMNPWWSVGIIVPLLNIFVGLRCLAYPEGYEDHKTLDTPAKVIIGIFVAIFVLAILAIVLAFVLSAR